jgi:hypothetical protein
MKKWIWIVLALPVVLAGCDLFHRDFTRTADDFADSSTGSLVLLLDGNTIGTKTIAPPNMTAARYDIELTHDTASTISEENWASSVYTKNGLAEGLWHIKITAEDADGIEIGAISGSVSATDSFTITAGEVLSKTVSLIPLVGNGGLSLTLDWPEGTVNSPVTMAAWLVPENAPGPSTDNDITFSVVEGNRTASYTVPSLAAGYYTLYMQLSGDGEVVWGWVESVRIVSGMTTGGSLHLVSGTGGLSLTIVVDLENPIVIDWIPTTPPTSITEGNNLSIEADPAQDAVTGYSFSYQWYLEGAALAGQTNAVLTYGSALAVGDYALCVVVTEKQTLTPFAVRTISSNGFNFRVVPLP